MVIKDQIKTWIISGEIKPGDKIYSENELMKMFAVSRHTIRQAVGDLVHEGWLYREQGAGTFCSNKVTSNTLSGQQTVEPKPGKNIGVITTYISDYIFPSIIRGIESYLTEKGYTLTLACTNNDTDKEKQCLQMMLNRNIDGLIVEPTKSSNYNPNIQYYLELEQNNIPYLMINQFYSQLIPPHIIVNDEHGGYLATEHLIHLGHEKFLGLFKTDDLQGVNRMRGFIRAFRENGLTASPEAILTYNTEERYDPLMDRLLNLFKTGTRPTAIVCYNDELAIHVLEVLRNLGIRVPDEISIVGYDDSFLAEASDIKLTTVAHPKMNMGMDAARWIVSAVENNSIKSPSIVYDPELVVRTSTAPVIKEQCE